MNKNDKDHGCCSSCHLVLKQPFIVCKTCKQEAALHICLDCFSKGREFGKHKKTHRYTVVNEDFSVLDATWTAADEVKLLEALIQKGEGNWEEISKSLASEAKSPLQCQRHYENFYLDGDGFKNESGFVNHIDDGKRDDQPVLFVPNEGHHGQPLRPANRSTLHKDLAGYNAARGDFDWESDNLAEMELNLIEANDDLYLASNEDLSCDSFANEDAYLVAALSTTALQVHNQRLGKRWRRKRMVREHGLLNKARYLGLPRRYPAVANAGNKYEHVTPYSSTAEY